MRFMSRLAAIVAAATIVASPAVAQKLGGLQAATTVNATDKIPVSQNGVTSAITPVQLATYLAPTFQASDADLTAIAALSTTPFGRSLLTMADAPAIRAAIGVTAAGADTTYLYRSNNLSDLTSVSAARSNLGLVIGTTIETWSANLDALAALTGTNTIYYRSGTNTWSPIVLGPNFAFSGGNLTIPGLPISLSGDVSGSSTSGSGAITVTLATVPISKGGTGATTLAGAQSALGLGTAALAATGTSGHVLGFLDGSNTYAGAMTFSQTITGSVTGNAGTATRFAGNPTINGVAFTGANSITVTAVDTATPRLAAANNLTDVASARLAAAALGVPWTLARSGAASSVTNTTSETTLATITVPAGAIGANGTVEILPLFAMTGNAVIRVRFGGTAMWGAAASSVAAYRAYVVISNAASTGSQVAVDNAIGIGSGNSLTASVDTTASVPITITAAPGATGTTVTLQSYVVRVTYGA